MLSQLKFRYENFDTVYQTAFLGIMVAVFLRIGMGVSEIPAGDGSLYNLHWIFVYYLLLPLLAIEIVILHVLWREFIFDFAQEKIIVKKRILFYPFRTY